MTVQAHSTPEPEPKDLSSTEPANDEANLDSPSEIGRAVRNMLLEMEESAIFLDPPGIFDDAILGVTEGDLGPIRVIYDSEKCVEQLAGHNGWDHEEAMEYFSFNTLGTHCEGYPLFLGRPFDMPAAGAPTELQQHATHQKGS